MSNLTAAFLGLGMASADLRKTLAHYECGHVELTDSLCAYAGYIDKLFITGIAIVGGYPGVGEYEVTQPFGQWFTEKVLDCEPGHEPELSMCREKLIQLMLEFFTQAPEAAPRAQVEKALRAVYFQLPK